MDAAEPTYLLQGEKDWQLVVQVGMESKAVQGEGRWEVGGSVIRLKPVSTGRKEDEVKEDKGMVVLGKS